MKISNTGFKVIGEKLYRIENLKDIIEALIYPVVDSVDYEIVWE